MLPIILDPIFELVFIFLGYIVGVVPVMIGSLGSLEPGPLEKAGDYSFYRANGRTYLPAETVALVGWLLISSPIGLVLLVIKLGM